MKIKGFIIFPFKIFSSPSLLLLASIEEISFYVMFILMAQLNPLRFISFYTILMSFTQILVRTCNYLKMCLVRKKHNNLETDQTS